MATTASSRLTRASIDAIVRSALRGAKVLGSTRAVRINGGMPANNTRKRVTIPYLSFAGEFVELADTASGTASDFSETGVDVDVKRASLGVDLNTGAIRASEDDLVGISDEVLGESLEYFLEKQSMKLLASASIPAAMVKDKSSAASVTGDHLDETLYGCFGDEDADALAWVMHPAVRYDAMALKEYSGSNKPLLQEITAENRLQHRNRPIYVSELAPQTFNVVAVSKSVGGDPTCTVTGRASGFSPIKLIIRIGTGGTVGTATFDYSLDNGTTYSTVVPTASAVVLGTTGLTANFAAGTYTAGATQTYTTTYESLLVAENAATIWFNGSLSIREQIDAARDAQIQWHHLYWAEHVYTKRPRRQRPGVAKLITKSSLVL